MNATNEQYSILVRGRLSERLASIFDGLELRSSAGMTELRGVVADQAELFGHLLRLRDLGIELISVNPASEA
jgi:hypothetical protein